MQVEKKQRRGPLEEGQMKNYQSSSAEFTAMRGWATHVFMNAFMEGLTISSITLLLHSKVSDHTVQGGVSNTRSNLLRLPGNCPPYLRKHDPPEKGTVTSSTS